MNHFERKVLIDKLTEPEIGDGAAFGVISIGVLAIGSIAGAITIPAVLAVAGPALAVIGFGGTTYMVVRTIINKKSVRKEA